MKKILLYIVILIALVGFFIPVTVARAVETYGTCTLTFPDGFKEVKQNETATTCPEGRDPSSMSQATKHFEPYSASNQNPIQTSTPDQYRECINQGLLSRDQCRDLWAPATAPNYNNLTPSSSTSSSAPADPTKYTLLAPLPCNTPGIGGCDSGKLLRTFDPTGASGDALSGYLNLMISIFIGISAVLAVIMIVWGGIEYMTTELISSKEAGKQRITNAIFGLVLALGAWTILNQINPDLLDVSLKSLEDVAVEVTLENFIVTDASGRVVGPINPRSVGTLCDQREVAAAAQAAGQNLTSAQIGMISCIGGIESSCQPVQNYNWGSGSSAYGPFQILLQGNAGCFESDVCRQAAEVNGPLNCATGFRDGNPIPGSPIVERCKKAANNFTCSVSAAACLIKNRPDYGDWNANAKLSWCKSQFNH